MDFKTYVQSVVASNFMRHYRARAARAKELDMLPQDVRKVLGEVADRISLPQKELSNRAEPGWEGY